MFLFSERILFGETRTQCNEKEERNVVVALPNFMCVCFLSRLRSVLFKILVVNQPERRSFWLVNFRCSKALCDDEHDPMTQADFICTKSDDYFPFNMR